MKLSGFFAFALLSISILSYGASDVAFADHGLDPTLPIESDSKSDIYSNGASVIINGTVEDYDSDSLTAGDITYVVWTPDRLARVHIGQSTPNSDGSFKFDFIAGGELWKTNGDYIVELTYGADHSEISINYVGGEAVISTPPPPPVEPTVIEPPPVEPTVIEPPPVEPTVIEPTVVEPVKCGTGTAMVDGVCRVISAPPQDSGCLIATAAYGTELAPQVQLLREIRDNTLFSTTSGTAFMSGFNTLYYSFAPTVADWERENPMFKETVKIMITPMLSTLSIMSLADEGSEAEVLGLGISVIALNLGMYVAAPALIGFKVNKIIKSRK